MKQSFILVKFVDTMEYILSFFLISAYSHNTQHASFLKQKLNLFYLFFLPKHANKYAVYYFFEIISLLTLSPTALGPIGPRVFKGIQLKA
jgi:hypothetical protein